VVQPVLVLELIFALGLRVFILHDRMAPRTWAAALMICLGLAAFLVAAAPGEGSGVPDARQWLLAVGTRGLAVAAPGAGNQPGPQAPPPGQARRHQGRRC